MSKTKYICIVFILICVIGIFAVFSNSANKRSEQKKSSIDKDIRSSNTPDYEFYLSNNPIDKLNDKYNLLNSIATISNDYQNSFMNVQYGISEIFPNLAYFDYTTNNKNKYQLVQSYYNVSNDNSFKSYDNYDFVNMDKRSYLENENINIVKGTSLINGSMLIDDNIYSKYKSSELYNYSYDFQNDLNKIGNDISYVDSCSIPTNTYL